MGTRRPIRTNQVYTASATSKGIMRGGSNRHVCVASFLGSLLYPRRLSGVKRAHGRQSPLAQSRARLKKRIRGEEREGDGSCNS
jgi:hypothetical protein